MCSKKILFQEHVTKIFLRAGLHRNVFNGELHLPHGRLQIQKVTNLHLHTNKIKTYFSFPIVIFKSIFFIVNNFCAGFLHK